jgi:hypothetical protein
MKSLLSFKNRRTNEAETLDESASFANYRFKQVHMRGCKLYCALFQFQTQINANLFKWNEINKKTTRVIPNLKSDSDIPPEPLGSRRIDVIYFKDQS